MLPWQRLFSLVMAAAIGVASAGVAAELDVRPGEEITFRGPDSSTGRGEWIVLVGGDSSQIYTQWQNRGESWQTARDAPGAISGMPAYEYRAANGDGVFEIRIQLHADYLHALLYDQNDKLKLYIKGNPGVKFRDRSELIAGMTLEQIIPGYERP